MDEEKTEILSLRFNQTYECLMCTTQHGFIVFNVNPFNCVINRIMTSGFRLGAMYQRSNIFFLSGTGNSDEYPVNRVCIWDDYQQKKTAEISTNSRVEQFYVSPKDTLLVSNKRRAFIYQINGLKLLRTIDICSYTLQMNFTPDDNYLLAHAYLSKDKVGYITFHDTIRMRCAKAHQSSLDCVSISHDNSYVATCSEGGTIIKLLDVEKCVVIEEFRRGSFRKKVQMLTFSSRDKWILTASTGGTMHFFQISVTDPDFHTLWGVFRKRSSFSVKVDEEIEQAYLDDDTLNFYLVTKSKFYSGHLTPEKAIIDQSVLLIYKKDPFSPSPKIFKKNKIAENKDQNGGRGNSGLAQQELCEYDGSDSTRPIPKRRPRSNSEGDTRKV